VCGEVVRYHHLGRGISLSRIRTGRQGYLSCTPTPVKEAAMDGGTLGMALAVFAAGGLIWWGLHSSPIDGDLIDRQADRAFRARTGGKPLGT
jgi:hypothetical protein